MTRSKIIASALAAFLVVLFSIYWFAAAPRELLAVPGKDQPDTSAGITKDSIPELKKNLWTAQSYQEINQVIDSLRSLPGPNAEAAGVLLEYLKENNRDDVWRISDALIKLMTGDQVARLAGEIASYHEANIGRYLIPVLAARIDDKQSLTSAIISLQKMPDPGLYRQIMVRAWGKIFTETGDTARWLDDIHAGLTHPRGKENLVLAVSLITRKQLTGDRRLEVINWLWQVQEEELGPTVRCRQLLNLYQLGRTEALEAIGRLYGSLPSARERANLINEAGSTARRQPKESERDTFVRWLWGVAEKDTLPFSRQECLQTLYGLGEREALDRLVRDIDQNGVATYAGEAGVVYGGVTNWQILKEINEKYSQSYLARGIRAYEEVRGEPYFELDRREKYAGKWPVYFHGDDQYNPDIEIPGWEKFLSRFPGHPETDDAAYRLARCYEIEGRWAEALNTLQKALSLPDGDIRYHAAGRTIYILDVRMTHDQLKELPRQTLAPSLHPLLDYTLAVREIRRDNYREAALALAEFLKTYSESETRDLPPIERLHTAREYDFQGAVEKQLSRLNELAVLKEQWEKSRDPERLYALAAAVYHDQTLYYNHLWAGHRQWYNWLGYINDTANGRAPEEMAAFALEMINYSHSLGYFQRVYEDPAASPELKAKALYSTGLSYIGIDQWGQDAWFGFSRTGVKQKVISVYQQFLKEYPDSSLLDGALLALGAYTGEAGYLEKIIRDYPGGEMAEKAQELLEEIKSPHYSPGGGLYGSPAPFKILSGANQVDPELPEEVKKWAVSSSRNQSAGSMTYGEWTYILIATGERPTAGYEVEIINISDNGSGQLNVRYRVTGPKPGQAAAQVITRPHILARIPASNSVVEFINEK